MENIPSRQTLEEAPNRTVQFLNAVGRNPMIFAALAARGYNQDEHHRGFDLLREALALHNSQERAMAAEARDAIAALDQWDEPNFLVARSALERLHPEQASFVFDRLKAGQGFQAVLNVATFLERLEALESSPEREATREEDRAALETLARRGINTFERQRLSQWVAQAQQVPSLPSPQEVEENAANDAARVKALTALYFWHRDWSNTARVSISRRDHLISLGLSSRRPAPAPQNDPETL